MMISHYRFELLDGEDSEGLQRNVKYQTRETCSKMNVPLTNTCMPNPDASKSGASVSGQDVNMPIAVETRICCGRL